MIGREVRRQRDGEWVYGEIIDWSDRHMTLSIGWETGHEWLDFQLSYLYGQARDGRKRSYGVEFL